MRRMRRVHAVGRAPVAAVAEPASELGLLGPPEGWVEVVERLGAVEEANGRKREESKIERAPHRAGAGSIWVCV